MNAQYSGKYELLDQIAEEFADRFRRGERPALAEYIQRYPELEVEIRELIPAVVEVERAEPAVQMTATVLRQVGDYRIMREIGRGGMGVVYEAEQSSLGRHVALKVLPVGASRPAGDGKALERFKREARAAAKLHHTNIVPVFDVGEFDDVCFYAMQFIQGKGLDVVIAELRLLRSVSERKKQVTIHGGRQTLALPAQDLPAQVLPAEELARSMLTGRFRARDLTITIAPEQPAPDFVSPPASKATIPEAASTMLSPGQTELSAADTDRYHYLASVARIGRQIAAALAHAHERGIVHRDIKPSNLLLDASGIVWVTDFGLAKTEEGDLTSPGDILGTIRYMAPERFKGHSDPRSDVYALGATLYELLVLRPAFEGCDRATLMAEIASDDPPRPRSLDRRIPRDLETIVLKAMARDPARRYATAEALADDLGRFLENRPIQARRSSSTERLWRWCRRNPAIALLLTTVFALLSCLTIGSIAVAIHNSRQSTALATAERDRAATEKERTTKIYETYQARLAQAYANRSSQRAGQRMVTLEAVREAVELVREQRMPVERLDELRNLAIAALTLPDVRTVRSWKKKADFDWWDTDRDVQILAGRTAEGQVWVNRIDTDEVITRFAGVEQARLSPNGRFVVGFGGNRFGVWKLATPNSTLILQGQQYGVAFHPDGRHLLTAGRDGALWLHDLHVPDQPPSALMTIEPAANGFAFGPQGRWLAVTRPKRVDIVDVRRGQTVVTIPEAGLITPAWHPGGKYLALVSSKGVVEVIARTAGGRDIQIWDIERKKRTAVLRGCPSGGVRVAFTPDGDRLLATGRDSVLRLWDWRTGRQVLQHSGQSNLQVSPTGRLLIDSERQWHLLELTRGLEYRTFVQQSTDAERVFYREPIVHPDGRLLAVNMSGNDVYHADQLLLLFDLDRGEELAAIPQARFRTVFQADGTLVTNGDQGLLRWPIREVHAGHWHVGPPKLLYPESFVDMAADRNGEVIGQADGRNGALLVRPGKGLAFLGPHGAAQHLSISPDGRYAVTGINDGEAGVKLWDMSTRRLLKTFPVGVHCAGRFSPDGRWLAVQGSTGSAMVKVGTWETAHTRHCGNVAFCPDGSLYATAPKQGLIQLLDPSTGRELARLEDPDHGSMDLVFTPDGTRLVTSSIDAQAIHVWDLGAIREQLAKLGLDWGTQSYPHAERPAPAPLRVTVDLGFVDARQSVKTQSVRLALAPFDGEAYLERGQAYERLQQAKQAVADFSMALTLLPAHHIRRAEALLYRSRSYRKLGDHAAACADLQQIAEKDLPLAPELTGIAAEACNDLAWRYVAGPAADRDPPRALPLIQKAIQWAPDDPNLANTRGVVHYRLGQNPQAVQWLERSLRESHGEAAGFNLFFLAMCHAKRGESATAKECYDRAVRWMQQNQAAIRQQPSWGPELRDFQAEADAVLAAGAMQ